MWHYSYHDNNSSLMDTWNMMGSALNHAYSSREEGDKLYLFVDLPGAKSSDVKVESVVGQVKIFGKQKGKDFHQAYSLPKSYDPASGVAKLEDGVLTLTFSKIKTAKSLVHSIEVK